MRQSNICNKLEKNQIPEMQFLGRNHELYNGCETNKYID